MESLGQIPVRVGGTSGGWHLLFGFAAVLAGALLLLPARAMKAQELAPESFRARRLTLDLALDYGERRLAGAIVLEMENWTKAPSDRVSLLLNRLMDVAAVQDAAGAPVSFTSEVARFKDIPMWQVTRVDVHLPDAVPPGGRATLRVRYAGNLVGYSEVGMLYVRDRIDTAFTIIREDALAFPTIGGLSATANRQRPRVPFVYQVALRVPSRYVVATGGTGTRTENGDGTATWRYESGKPAPFLNVCIARFDTLSAAGVRLFALHEDSASGRRVLGQAQQALGLLTTWFGEQRSRQTVTITEIPDGWGSQADIVAGIIQSAAAFRDPARSGELYHELTHLWNAVDTDNPSPRWNEGLATFLQDVLRENVDGWTGRGDAESANLASVKRAVATDSTLGTIPMMDYGRTAMTGRSYRVGALMFATLWQVVGPTRFNTIVGGYYQKYERGGSTRDFVAYASQISGRNLDAFFDDWIFTTRWVGKVSSAGSVSELAAHYR